MEVSKQIVLVSFTHPDPDSDYTLQKKYYRLKLGNGCEIRVKNKRQLFVALKHINDSLNSLLDVMLIIPPNIIAATYVNWHKYRIDEINAIIDSLKQAERFINLAVTRCQMDNGNYFVFSHLQNAIQEYLHAIKTLKKHDKIVAEGSENICDIVINELQIVGKDLNFD